MPGGGLILMHRHHDDDDDEDDRDGHDDNDDDSDDDDDDDDVDSVLTTATMLRRRPSTTHSKLIRKKLRTRSGTKLDGKICFCIWARRIPKPSRGFWSQSRGGVEGKPQPTGSGNILQRQR